MMKIRINNLEKIKKKYSRLSKELAKEVDQALNDSANQAVRGVVDEIRNKRISDTNQLAQSVMARKKKPLQYSVKVDKEYGKAREDGTKPHYVSPRRLKGWARRKLGNESLAFVVSKKIRKYGTKPGEYWKDGIKKAKTFMNRRFKKIYKNIIK